MLAKLQAAKISRNTKKQKDVKFKYLVMSFTILDLQPVLIAVLLY